MSQDETLPIDHRSSAKPDDQEFETLVDRCLQRLEEEGETAVDALLERHPAAAAAVRQRLAQRRERQQSDPSVLPERFGRYRVIEMIGRGGMGVVYLAEQEDLGRKVAVKVLHLAHLLIPGARDRFRREVETIARLQHPGIVPIHDVGEEGGIPYFTMDWVEGINLGEMIRTMRQAPVEERTPAGLAERLRSSANTFVGTWPQAAARLLKQAAEAVHHAHTRGVIHRDIKPSNMILTPEGRIVLLDFGLATAKESNRLTRTGAMLGSLPYMAPEQVRGENERIDVRTDVYALGVSLYEVLAFQNPFIDPNPEVTRSRILDAAAEPLRRFVPEVSKDLETICLKAMSEDPSRRYVTAQAFADDLDAFLELRPVAAQRPGPIYRALRWTQRHPARAVAWALALICFVGLPSTWAVVKSRSARDLERALDDARAARIEAERGREVVTRAYSRSQSILDGLISRIAIEKLGDNPELLSLREWMLREALRSYEDLRKERAGDFVIERSFAAAASRVGVISFDLGQVEEALRLLQESIDLCESLLQTHGDDDETMMVEAVALGSYASMLRTRDEDAKRREISARSLELRRKLHEARPDDPERGDSLAMALTDHGRVLFHSMFYEEALSLQKQALELRRRLLAAGDPSQEIRVLELEAEISVIESNVSGGEPDSAAMERTVAAYEKLWAAAPKDFAYAMQVARFARALGQHHGNRGEYVEAEKWYGKAIAADGAAVEAYPNQTAWRSFHALSWVGMAFTLSSLNREDESWDCWRKAIEQDEIVARITPNSVAPCYDIGLAQKSLGAELTIAGHYEEGIERLARAIGRLGAVVSDSNLGQSANDVLGRAHTEFDQACERMDSKRMVAIAGQLAEAAAAVELDGREKESLVAAAIRLLRRADERGEVDVEAAVRQPVFAPLRDRADFQRLLQDL